MRTFKMSEINSETISNLKEKLDNYKKALDVATSFKDLKKEYDELSLALFEIINERSDAIDNSYSQEDLFANSALGIKTKIVLDKDVELLINKASRLIFNVDKKLIGAKK